MLEAFRSRTQKTWGLAENIAVFAQLGNDFLCLLRVLSRPVARLTAPVHHHFGAILPREASMLRMTVKGRECAHFIKQAK